MNVPGTIVHRSVGAFGYFPSYTLGAVMACQFLEAARLALPDLESSLEAGNFEPLKTWLNREVGGKWSCQTPAVFLGGEGLKTLFTWVTVGKAVMSCVLIYFEGTVF